MKKSRPWLLPVICYGAALVLYLAGCTVHLAVDASRAQSGRLADVALTYTDFEPVGFQPRGEAAPGLYVSTQVDAQLIYEPEQPFYASGFIFKGVARNKPGGEMVLYYKTTPGADYRETQKIWAEERPDGSWYFDLGGRKLAGLRFDPDPGGGVLWQVDGFWLEGKKPAFAYYLPDARTVFLLLFLPGFAAAVLQEGIVAVRTWNIRRRARAVKRPGS